MGNANQKSNLQNIESSSIVNISTKVLTRDQQEVLNLGLKFVPEKPKDYTKLKLEALEFCRKLRLKAFFSNQDMSGTMEVTGLRNKSSFIPPNNSVPKEIIAYEQTVLSSIKQLEKKKIFSKRNFSKDQHKALEDLKDDTSVVIKQADKGGAVVIWSREKYMLEGHKHVMNQEWYRPLKNDPTREMQGILNTILKSGLEAGFLGKNEFEFLNKKYPRVPISYLVPKIHKDLNSPPGRPIICGCDSLLEPVSKYIDFFLKPFVTEVPSFLRDTTDFIAQVEGLDFNKDTQLLVSFDVTSLYTQIPQEEALQVIELYLEKRQRPHQVPTSFIVQLAEIALKNNCFKFEQQFFVQIKGSAMGCPFAPEMAILFMAQYEYKYIYLNNPYFDTVLQ